MAELTVFAYIQGNTLLHRIDIRCKLVAIVLLDIVALQSQFRSLAMLALPVLAGLMSIRLPVRRTIWEIRYLLFFMGFLLLVHSISRDSGQTATFPYLSIRMEGVVKGGLLCCRLLIVILAGLLFMRTSRTLEVKAAIEWLLKPIPMLPERRIALMIGLMLRFLPDILQRAVEIGDAQKARGIENRRNPIVRITAFSIPLFRAVFRHADELSTAMEARCFGETRTDVVPVARIADWIFLLTAALFFAAVSLL